MTLESTGSIARVREVTDRARAAGRRVGFVPTMGYLHAGHASLVAAARAHDDLVVVSIFVNPLQFAPGEDLDAYPRDLERDLAVCAEEGADLVFAPPVEEMYPRPPSTTVTVSGVSEPLEGRSRPTHFAGVATVVAKLFAIVGPCRAYFGEKDWQQLRVVQTMAADLSLPVEVVGCPIVREPDGLALSSRNVYLSDEERAQAPVLHRALRHGAELVAGGETDPGRVEAAMAAVIGEAPLATLDYVAAVQADSLTADGPLHGEVRLLGAVRFGRARLIDNVGVTAPA
ncbi:MAG: pantoate--beta-alanine ligase [Actinomyces sp.]|nr:MAG: pantoate--beta-alanine ligase [Actinomyces sp.]